MKTVLLELFTSKKFLATLTAIVVYTGGRLGLSIDPAVLDHIWQALLVYVGAQGLADLNKSAAIVNLRSLAIAGLANPGSLPLLPRPPASTKGDGSKLGSATTIALIVLAGLVMSSVVSACSAAQRKDVTTTVGQATVECVGVDVGPIVAGIEKDCQPNGGDLDFSCVTREAVSGGLVVGGCAFVRVAEHYLASLALLSGSPTTSSTISGASLSEREVHASKALEDFRAEHAGGAKFHVEAGLR